MLTDTSLETHANLLAAAESIRPLPAGLVELAAILANPNCGVDDIEPIVRNDPALTAFAIREANSAASASQTEIVEIEAAIVRVGGARLLANAIAATMLSEMTAPLPGYCLGQGQLWEHSVATSYVAELVRAMSSADVGREVVTAAMLHDLGKLVVGKLAPGEALRRVIEQTGSITASERELFDIDHVELGVELARLWKLPEAIAEAIGGHHRPGDSAEAHALLVADSIAHVLVPVGSPDTTPDSDLERSLTTLGLQLEDVTQKASEILRRAGVLEPAAAL